MKLLLSLSVLLVVLAMVSEGAAPAQGNPDVSSTLQKIPTKLKEIGKTLEQKTLETLQLIKENKLATKAGNWLTTTLQKLKEKFKSALS